MAANDGLADRSRAVHAMCDVVEVMVAYCQPAGVIGDETKRAAMARVVLQVAAQHVERVERRRRPPRERAMRRNSSNDVEHWLARAEEVRVQAEEQPTSFRSFGCTRLPKAICAWRGMP